jgi:protein-disulfide isomerase
MVEFADLQCPFCQEYTTTIFPTIVAEYVRTGKVRMEFRNVSILGTDSVRAAQMAGAAGLQNKLWPFIDVFYNNQGEEKTGYVTDDFLHKVGSAVNGLDVTKAMNDRGTAVVQKQLDTAQSEMAANGFQGTPSFLLGRTGGRLTPLTINAFQLGQFTTPIDKLLGKT